MAIEERSAAEQEFKLSSVTAAAIPHLSRSLRESQNYDVLLLFLLLALQREALGFSLWWGNQVHLS